MLAAHLGLVQGAVMKVSRDDYAKVIANDITPPTEHVAIDPNETDEMRWRKAGVTAPAI